MHTSPIDRPSVIPCAPIIKGGFLRGARQNPAGFTVMEVLAAVALIGAVLVLLMAVGGQVRTTSNAAKCAHNLRQIWVAISLYANDHGGKLPGPSFQGITHVAPSLPAKLLDYTGGSDLLWDCPARPQIREMNGRTGYIQNYFRNSEGQAQYFFGYVERPSRPEMKAATFMEISLISDPRQRSVLTDVDVGNYDTPDLRKFAPEPAHRGARNVLYVDGHVILTPAARR